MEINILGPGCATCHKLFEMVKLAVAELGINASVVAITDMEEIRKYTLTSPGLLVNGKLAHAGKPLPTLEKLKELIKAAQ
jgi:small redox-active disulfide protein 2